MSIDIGENYVINFKEKADIKSPQYDQKLFYHVMQKDEPKWIRP